MLQDKTNMLKLSTLESEFEQIHKGEPPKHTIQKENTYSQFESCFSKLDQKYASLKQPTEEDTYQIIKGISSQPDNDLKQSYLLPTLPTDGKKYEGAVQSYLMIKNDQYMRIIQNQQDQIYDYQMQLQKAENDIQSITKRVKYLCLFNLKFDEKNAQLKLIESQYQELKNAIAQIEKANGALIEEIQKLQFENNELNQKTTLQNKNQNYDKLNKQLEDKDDFYNKKMDLLRQQYEEQLKNQQKQLSVVNSELLDIKQQNYYLFEQIKNFEIDRETKLEEMQKEFAEESDKIKEELSEQFQLEQESLIQQLNDKSELAMSLENQLDKMNIQMNKVYQENLQLSNYLDELKEKYQFLIIKYCQYSYENQIQSLTNELQGQLDQYKYIIQSLEYEIYCQQPHQDIEFNNHRRGKSISYPQNSNLNISLNDVPNSRGNSITNKQMSRKSHQQQQPYQATKVESITQTLQGFLQSYKFPPSNSHYNELKGEKVDNANDESMQLKQKNQMRKLSFNGNNKAKQMTKQRNNLYVKQLEESFTKQPKSVFSQLNVNKQM